MPQSLRLFSIPIVCAWLLSNACLFAQNEILYPGDAFAKLDTFEAVNLEEADKKFGAGDVKGAYASYKAFSFEFPKSKAMAYVQLRLGRCLHKLDKRLAAIKAYQDVVDYFPDDVRHAAAALYFIGECHGQNGDEAKKAAAWAQLVKDDGYVTQANSGTALAYLGAEMLKLGKFSEAAEYQWRTAVAFQKTNPAAAAAARKAVIEHFSLRAPDHDKLKEFYVAASGFDGSGRNTDKPDEDGRYWSTVLDSALGAKDAPVREKACAYWSAKMGDRFVDNDALRKQWFDAQFAHEKSAEGWVARLEKQYATKPASLDRVLQWCSYYKADVKRRSAFFSTHAKSLLAAMKPDELMQLVSKLRMGHLEMYEEARTVLRSIKLADLADADLVRYANLAAYDQSEEEVLGILARVKDKLFATKARFDYYLGRSHKNRPFMEKALTEIPELMKSPKYADGLVWTKANLLQGVGRYEDAIKAYREANRQPDSTWEISNCLVALKQFDQAIKTVSELEAVGGPTASQASLRVADIHRISGDKGREVTQLRTVLKRYPKSPQSSEAHNRLESYGVKLTGGEAEAED
jgi:tetratricopeptide (TPR) repeat protein